MRRIGPDPEGSGTNPRGTEDTKRRNTEKSRSEQGRDPAEPTTLTSLCPSPMWFVPLLSPLNPHASARSAFIRVPFSQSRLGRVPGPGGWGGKGAHARTEYLRGGALLTQQHCKAGWE